MNFAAIIRLIQLCLGISQSIIPIVVQIESAFPQPKIGKDIKLPLAKLIVTDAIVATKPGADLITQSGIDIGALVERVATATIDSRNMIPLAQDGADILAH